MQTITDLEITREIQNFCADIYEQAVEREEKFGRVDGNDWTQKDAEHVAYLLNQSDDPWGLFQHIDERTGGSDVGYRTRDGREWFHILRQMRNQRGSGLFENLPGRYS